MTAPPLGPYWSRNKPSGAINFSKMRQGATMQFDNSLSPIQKAVERYWGMILPEYRHLATDPGFGQPPMQLVHGQWCSFGSIEFAAMSSVILPHMRHRRAVLEIGGGYGGLAHALMAALPDCFYEIVDIPEVLETAKHYLECYRARFLPTTIEQFAKENGLYDLIIQTRGFMEMSMAEVEFYFERIQQDLLPGGLFFTINRAEKETRFIDYPFDDRWTVLEAGLWPSLKKMPMLLLRREEDSRPEIFDTIRALCG